MVHNSPPMIDDGESFGFRMDCFCNSITTERMDVGSETQGYQLPENFVHIPVAALWPVQTCNIGCNAVKVSRRRITYSNLIAPHSNRPVFDEIFPQIGPVSYNHWAPGFVRAKGWALRSNQLPVHWPLAEWVRFS